MKLQIKHQYVEVQRVSSSIAEGMEEAGIEYELRVKLLYHDREKVSGHLVINSPK